MTRRFCRFRSQEIAEDTIFFFIRKNFYQLAQVPWFFLSSRLHFTVPNDFWIQNYKFQSQDTVSSAFPEQQPQRLA